MLNKLNFAWKGVKTVFTLKKPTGFSSPLMMCVMPRITPDACEVSLQHRRRMKTGAKAKGRRFCLGGRIYQFLAALSTVLCTRTIWRIEWLPGVSNRMIWRKGWINPFLTKNNMTQDGVYFVLSCYGHCINKQDGVYLVLSWYGHYINKRIIGQGLTFFLDRKGDLSVPD